jgi:lipoprotein NlpD
VAGLALLALGGCAGNEPRSDTRYVVRAEDTLYSIAWRHDLDYRDLAKWNAIGPDYRIAVGQVLTLVPPAAGHGRAPPAHLPDPAMPWVWPTDHTAPPRRMPSGGILILGQPGQAVRAAAAGRVVYTGGGLRGYGQLVIIKHGDSLLSAYAYNRELRVHEGEQVQAGQEIAAMGRGAQQSAALYFEIRVNGKPTDPTLYLPSKLPPKK